MIWLQVFFKKPQVVLVDTCYVDEIIVAVDGYFGVLIYDRI